MTAPPKSFVPHWWRRALDDGAHCEAKRRERWFEDYLEAAEESLTAAGLVPEGLDGPFRLLYRHGFRLGYDNAAQLRKLNKGKLPRRKKHVILR